MRLFVSILSGDSTEEVRLYCDATQEEDCGLAKQEAIRINLPFVSPLEVVDISPLKVNDITPSTEIDLDPSKVVAITPSEIVGEQITPLAERLLLLSSFTISKQQLEDWSGANTVTDWLKENLGQLEIRDFSATPDGFFRAVMSADNFGTDFQQFLGCKIDLGVMGQVETPNKQPVQSNSIQCETT